MANGRPAKGPEWFLTYGVGNRLSGWCATAGKRYLKSTWGYYIRAGHEVPQVLFRLSRWENLEHAEKI